MDIKNECCGGCKKYNGDIKEWLPFHKGICTEYNFLVFADDKICQTLKNARSRQHQS